jgi:hypothetical protein
MTGFGVMTGLGVMTLGVVGGFGVAVALGAMARFGTIAGFGVMGLGAVGGFGGKLDDAPEETAGRGNDARALARKSAGLVSFPA